MANNEYYVTYHINEETLEEYRYWLKFNKDDEPLDLPSITDVCAAAKVNATLRDEQGFLKGSVDSEGNVRLV